MIGDILDPRKVFGQAVSEIANIQENIVILSADSGGSSGFSDFAKSHPDRYFEFGIMEQGVIGIASGLATTGIIPVFCAIAPFVTARPFEMFRNDLGYMKQNAKIVGRNGGLTYSDLGATHHSLEDYALMRMIPGVTVLAPMDPSEIRSAAKAMLEWNGPVYMRIGNEPIPTLFEDSPFDIGKGRLIQEGTDVSIITTGYITANVLKAVELMNRVGIYPEVIGMPTICPIDEAMILNTARKTKKVVTVEEHYVHGGLGSIVSEILSASYPVPVKAIGVPSVYAATGPYNELLGSYGLDAEGIFRTVQQFLKD